MPDLATLDRLIQACGLELHIEARPPDLQRLAAAEEAAARSVEDRVSTNSAFTELFSELRDG